MDRRLYDEIRNIEADHWWYVGRRRIVFDWIRLAAASYTNPRVLDLGCGTGFNAEQLQFVGLKRIIGVDVSAEALSYCRSRHLHGLVQADGAKLPFVDQCFEIVIALDLIEHIENDEAALQEIARLLRPGGTLLLFTPAYRFLWSVQDEVSHHFRRYTLRELRAKLTRSGFVVRKLTYANTFLFPMVLAGRMVLRFSRDGSFSENALHPSWSNGTLARIFGAEVSLLRHVNLPFGVSLLSLATRV